MRSEVIESILKNKIITIVRGVDSDKLKDTVEAMCRGGIRLIEITYDASGKVSDEETANNIKMLCEEFSGRMFIGAGTVLRENQVELTKKAGGTFIISPDTNEKVIKKTVELGMVSIPGALTPTECNIANRAGADFVKLFPVDSLGLSYIKAIKAPLSHINFLAVGGVNEKNLKDYLDTGISGFGIGSSIVKKELINKGEFDKLTEAVRKYTIQID